MYFHTINTNPHQSGGKKASQFDNNSSTTKTRAVVPLGAREARAPRQTPFSKIQIGNARLVSELWFGFFSIMFLFLVVFYARYCAYSARRRQAPLIFESHPGSEWWYRCCRSVHMAVNFFALTFYGKWMWNKFNEKLHSGSWENDNPSSHILPTRRISHCPEFEYEENNEIQLFW